MKTILSDYVALLPERGGLDSLLPDLLRSMNIVPLSEAQIGAVQYGADVAGVGPDPDDGVTKLLLFTIKKGDLTRSEWNVGEQAVRPSLDQLFDVYLPTHVEAAYEALPKKVVLVFGGTLQQTLQLEWAAYTRRRSGEGLAELTAWNGERLAELIERHMLDELAVLGEARGHLRKALALLDVPDYDLTHFDLLLKQALDRAGSQTEQLRALRQVNLAVRILFHEALRVNVLRPAYRAAERAVLAVWAWMRERGLLDAREVIREFEKVSDTLWVVGQAYAERLRPLCSVREGLMFGYQVDELEYPLRTFQVLGELSAAGLTGLDRAAGGDDGAAMAVGAIAAEVLDLIRNNPSATAPLYDDHAVDIALALLLLYRTGYGPEATTWSTELVQAIAFARDRVHHHFPISRTDYRELVDLVVGRGNPNVAVPFSSILPMLAEWAHVLGSAELYDLVKETAEGPFASTDLQLWHPDAESERLLFTQDAKDGSGTTWISIRLPDLMADHRAKVEDARAYDADATAFSFVQRQRWAIGHVASKHYRTPVAPASWRSLMPPLIVATSDPVPTEITED